MQADNQVEQNRKHFYDLSLEYVCKLQEIQERKKFECVEPVSISEFNLPYLSKGMEKECIWTIAKLCFLENTTNCMT